MATGTLARDFILLNPTFTGEFIARKFCVMRRNCFILPSESLGLHWRGEGGTPYGQIELLDFSRLGALTGIDRLQTEPVDTACQRLEQVDLSPILHSLIPGTDSTSAREWLRIGLLADLGSRAYDVGRVLLWQRSRGTKVLVLTQDWRDRMLVPLSKRTQVQVVYLPPIVRSIMGLALRLVKTLKRPRTLSLRQQDRRDSQDVEESADSPALLVVPHKSMTYGQLYSWEDLIGQAQCSYMAVNYDGFAYTSDARQPDAITTLSPWLNLVRALPRMLSAGTFWKHPYLSLALARINLRSDVIAKRFERLAPDARVAFVTYEMLVPPTVSLALKKRNIHVFATLERPAGARLGYPYLLDTLCVPSLEFANYMKNFATVSVGQFVPTGLWRTDFLKKNDAEAIGEGPHSDRMAPTVVVLPYHLEENPVSEAASVYTTRQQMSDILELTIELSERFPNLDFVVRAKNSNWIGDERLKDVLTKCHSRSNVRFSDDYSRMNESYRLCSGAAAVIGRYSSLLDECIAAGIPTLVYDALPNSKQMSLQVATHLPKRLLVQTHQEVVQFLLDTVDLDGNYQKGPWVAGQGHWLTTDTLILGGCDGEAQARVIEELTEILNLLEGKDH